MRLVQTLLLYATIEQLLVLANLESANAMFIENGIEQSERVVMLNQLAIKQLKTLSEAANIKRLDLLDGDNKLK